MIFYFLLHIFVLYNKPKISRKMKTLTTSQFENNIESIGAENIDVNDYLLIDGKKYTLTLEQEIEVLRIQDLINQEDVSEEIQFEKGCYAFEEVGF